jgi:hypothetical protein
MGTIILAFVGVSAAGLFAYFLRCRSLFWFGIGEIAVSFALVALIVQPPISALLVEEPSWWAFPLSKGVAIVLAVYVMVRGLDNVEQSLRPVARAIWRRIFYDEVQR